MSAPFAESSPTARAYSTDAEHRSEDRARRFDYLQQIGVGGMGVVYEVHDHARGERVALKELSRADAANIYRFKREFRALTGVRHPNLVQLHELFRDRARWFFTMELVRGNDFVSYLHGDLDLTDVDTLVAGPAGDGPERDRNALRRSAVTLSSENVARLRAALLQLTQGIMALHAAGMLHCDIKPSNVLVTPAGRVVVLDFGLVSETRGGVRPSPIGDPNDEEWGLAGTPPYMSPERIAGHPIDASSDWYSVGALLYEALTGHPPFEGQGAQLLLAKQFGLPQAPSSIVKDVPEDLERLCLDLLQVDRRARPTGAEVLARLEPPAVRPRRRSPSGSLRSLHALLPHFVGRELPLRRLRDAFCATRAGRRTVVRLRGPGGMGKTILAHRFLDLLRDGGEAVVLEGRCSRHEAVPYQALDGIIDGLTRHLRRLGSVDLGRLLPRNIGALARLFPVLDRVPAIHEAPPVAPGIGAPTDLAWTAFGALRTLLSRMAHDQPLVLFIDDLHFADPDSALALATILRGPDPPPLLLIVSFRDDHHGPLRLLLQRQALLPVRPPDRMDIKLGPLSPAEARSLARRLLRDAPEATSSAAIADTSGGLPAAIVAQIERLLLLG